MEITDEARTLADELGVTDLEAVQSALTNCVDREEAIAEILCVAPPKDGRSE